MEENQIAHQYKIIDDLMSHTNYDRNTLKNIINTNDLYFFKDEILNKKNIVDSIINYKKNNYSVSIYARKCEIIENVDTHTKSKFLNDNHIQGNDNSNYNICAYYNDELVAMMCFDNNRSFNKNKDHDHNTYELTRFCVKNNYKVVGIASKLINNFIKLKNPYKIITFFDCRFANDGNVYKTIGFRKIKKLPSDYHYISPDGKRLHKYNFGKSKIKTKFPHIYDVNKTETSMMEELGYKLIWDAGKIKYEIQIEDGEIIVGFIYKITNLINNKIYIGQTLRTLEKRISEYKKSLLNKVFFNKYLYNSFNKYGFDNFKFEVIDTASSIDELNQKEIKYISEFNSTNKNIGYNLELGGRNSLPSPETLEKMSKSHTGIKQTDNWIKKRIHEKGSDNAKKYGRKKTDEDKKRLSEISPKYWLGKERDEETRRKISETKKRNGVSQKTLDAQAKTVYVINVENGEYKSYHSTSQASQNEGISGATVSRYCNANKIKNGFKWTYVKPD